MWHGAVEDQLLTVFLTRRTQDRGLHLLPAFKPWSQCMSRFALVRLGHSCYGDHAMHRIGYVENLNFRAVLVVLLLDPDLVHYTAEGQYGGTCINHQV